MGKVIDAINASIEEGKPFFSFEYFPPKTTDGVDNLFERMDRMVSYGPRFCDITWGAGGSTADLTLDIAEKMQNMVNIECMMHLTCTNMPEEKLHDALTSLKASGVTNILALRGDPPHGQDKFEAVEGGFSCALDLVKFIRKQTGDHFGIGVSGYPEAHPDAIVDDPEQMEKNYWADIHYLKEKLDAGAQFVITQLFYDVDKFIKWVHDCRSVGITAPILPGIMPIMTYGGFIKMTGFCKTYVPQEIRDKIESLKDDDKALKEYGIALGVDMCKKILDAGVSPGLHMYSLNQDQAVLNILERLKFLKIDSPPRPFPFRPRTRMLSEGVRPVHWVNRPRSYLQRTAAWSTCPAHSWTELGDVSFAAPSEECLKVHVRTEKQAGKALDCWGQPETVDAIKEVFDLYWTAGGAFPWAEKSTVPAGASNLVPKLKAVIQKGYLPITAMPMVNALKSGDAVHGWGSAGGLVYQKAYLEFFCSPDTFQAFLSKVRDYDSMTFMAVSSTGKVMSDSDSPTCITWGVFPGKEVLQPYIASMQAFSAWAQEAFQLWESTWIAVLPEGAPAAKLLKEVKDEWFLVSLVENDYLSGDIFKVLT